jgi:Lon protease-like protein
MQQRLLPLFPLQTVLLPGTPLPLHIFEPRYREMFAELLEEDGEFGVVLAREQGILRTGCTAEVVEVAKRYEDGRLDVQTMGHRRFRIRELDTERSFLRAEVEYFDDVEFTLGREETVREAAARRVTLARLSGEEVDPVDLDGPYVSFRLAQISSDLDFRQTLLEVVSEAERIEMVNDHLEQMIERQKLTAAMRKVSRRNGHGTHVPGLDG